MKIEPAHLAHAHPSAEAGQAALRAHLVERATAARLRYGLYIDGRAILDMLSDREVVRHPVVVRFDESPLLPGEFACLMPAGPEAQAGVCITVHPCYEHQPDIWPLLIAYYIPDINYGEVITAAEAELYGATLLGLDIEEYYQALCELADNVAALTTTPGPE